MVSVRSSLKSGIIYTAIARYSGIIISIFIGAVLARLLTPEEFGIVALIMVFITFFNLLSDFGIGAAVVQNQSLLIEDLKSIFSFSILLGIGLAGFFFLMAPFFASFYKKPELMSVSRLLSLAVLFHSLQIVPKALYQKALKFKKIGIISLVVQSIGGILAIGLAYYGFSYYSLVFQSIFVGLISLIIFYGLAPIKITWFIQKESIKKIFRFSSFQFMFNFINYFSRNADNLLIGKYFGVASLGFYDKSYRLMTLPVSNLTHVFTPVLMPVLAKFQDDKNRIFQTYLKVIRLLATIGFPLSIFLYFSAYEIINIIYGSQWDQSIPVFKLLALTVGIQVVLSTSGSIFQAVNRTDLLFYSGVLSSIFMVGGICYGVFIGKSLESIGYGLIIAFSINFFQGFFMLIKLALNSSFSLFLKTFIFPIVLSLGVTLALWLTSDYIFSNKYYSIMIKILVGGISFGLIYIYPLENRKLVNRYFGKFLNFKK